MEYFIHGGALLSLFCGFVILKKEEKKQADYIISSILFILCLNYLLISFYPEKANNVAPHLFGFAASLILVYGPLIYFYTLAYTDKGYMNFKNSYLHFIPFVLYAAFNLHYFLNDAVKEHNYLEDAYLDGRLGFFYAVTLIKGLHPVIYLMFSLNAVINHQKNVLNIYSYDSSSINIKWMRYLVISMIVLVILIAVLNVFRVGKTEEVYHMAGEIIAAFATTWVFTIGYYGFKKTPVFVLFPNYSSSKEKYQNTKIGDDSAENIQRAVVEKMEEQKPYLDPRLSISEFAQLLNYPSYQISQVLNDKMGMTFFDFVNGYRVKEIVAKMAEKGFRQLTLLGNALECGFNSKASFNRIFKKVMGVTPSEYYKQNHG